jgi:hypothetical protein
MQRIKPAHTDQLSGGGRWCHRLLVGGSVHKSKGRGDGAELRRGPEGKVDLQGIGEQEDPIKGDAPGHIHVMDGSMLVVHAIGPVGQHLSEIGISSNAPGQINIRPLILTTDRG